MGSRSRPTEVIARASLYFWMLVQKPLALDPDWLKDCATPMVVDRGWVAKSCHLGSTFQTWDFKEMIWTDVPPSNVRHGNMGIPHSWDPCCELANWKRKECGPLEGSEEQEQVQVEEVE